jgi:hypothetical protein
MIVFLFLLLIISLFLEGTLASLPLVFVCLLCLTIVLRSSVLFLVAFLAGILLDVFALRSVGETSMFLLGAIFLLFLYQRKYEINSYPFVLLASFIGSLLYLFFFGYPYAFLQAILCTIFAAIVFTFIKMAIPASQKTPYLDTRFRV